MLHLALLFVLHVCRCDDSLPYVSGVKPELSYNGEKLKFGMGAVKDSYGAAPFLQIPVGDGSQLRVPKAFYHYTERDLGADAGWGVPSDGRLMALNTLVKNNRKEMNGVYLPFPNMDPINLHFISQKTFEKGIDTSAQDGTPSGALEAAKSALPVLTTFARKQKPKSLRFASHGSIFDAQVLSTTQNTLHQTHQTFEMICRISSEAECEEALLHYHRTKANALRQQSKPLHQQLLNLSDLTSYSTVRDREGGGLGVVVGVPGYDPLYVGAALNANKDAKLGLRFSPPE